MTAYVFIGPTIGPDDAGRELDAIYLPPVAQGDVIRVMAMRPTAIGIVDGYFERVPAVWHKEILWALAEGVPVFGSASMGALRAAELAAFGMEGVGTIFERYRDGALEDDDEVAVAHAEADQGFRAMSEAMVVIRDTLARAEREAVIAADDRDALEDVAKALYYPDRIWPAIISGAARAGASLEALVRFREWLPAGRVDVKRTDAIAMLRRMRAHEVEGAPRVRVAFEFEHTEWWHRARRTAGELQRGPSGELFEVDARRVLDEARLSGAYRELRRAVALGALAAEEARRARTTPGADLRQEIVEELAARAPAGDLAAWRATNGVSARHLDELVSDQAVVRWAERAFSAEIVRRGPDHLRVTGDYARLLARARAKEQALSEAGLADAAVEDTGLTPEALADWLVLERGISLPRRGRQALATELGYADPEALDRALAAEYLFRRLEGRTDAGNGAPAMADGDR